MILHIVCTILAIVWCSAVCDALSTFIPTKVYCMNTTTPRKLAMKVGHLFTNKSKHTSTHTRDEMIMTDNRLLDYEHTTDYEGIIDFTKKKHVLHVLSM